MKKFKVAISVLLVLIIAMSSVLTTFATTINVFNDKISEQLKTVVSEDKLDSISVYIFLNRCDKSVVYKNLEEKHNYNTKAYENKVVYYKEVVPNITVGNKKVSEVLNGKEITARELSLDNDDSSLDINTRKSINRAMVDDANKYLDCYRDEIASLVGSYVSKFVESNKKLLEEIIVQPKSAEFIIAEIKTENLSELVKLPIVEEIDLFENKTQYIESWNTGALVESDSNEGLGSELYNYGSGFDGTGVNIGIIEAGPGKYNESNYNLSEANLTFVPTPGAPIANVSSHATNVTALICGKKTIIDGKTYEGAAKGANVYQTGIYDENNVIDAIEMFVEMGVDIINYSGGRDTGLGYDGYDKSVDRLITNNRILFVKSAGNKGTGGCVTSPGKAYNALTVGDLKTKESSVQVSVAPYSVSSSSSTDEDDYLANKPDVVAPGTSLCLPKSSTEWIAIGSGTSYAAPQVTAMAAQIMQSECFAIFNPNAAKNYIICGASNNDITGTTVSYGALKDESGAGLVNAVNSYECSNFGTEYYGVYLASQNAPTDYRTVATFDLAKGEHLRIALTFEKEEYIDLISEYGNNIDIRLVRDNPYSTYCVSSESTTNNVELIDTWITTTGEYCLQIRLTDSILEADTNNDLHYWISWRTY